MLLDRATVTPLAEVLSKLTVQVPPCPLFSDAEQVKLFKLDTTGAVSVNEVVCEPPFKDADTDLFAAFRSVFVEGRIDPNKNLLYDVLKPG